MFIFQNNRGKAPTKLELIKAQCMFVAPDCIGTIKRRFANINKYITLLEEFVHEDMVLQYALKVYYNSLYDMNSLEKIDSELSKNQSKKEATIFVEEFFQLLEESFCYMKTFFIEAQNKDNAIDIHFL